MRSVPDLKMLTALEPFTSLKLIPILILDTKDTNCVKANKKYKNCNLKNDRFASLDPDPY
jgi:hypothetical protein